MNQYVYEIKGRNGLSEVILRFRQDRKQEDRHLFISLFHDSNDPLLLKTDISSAERGFSRCADCRYVFLWRYYEQT